MDSEEAERQIQQAYLNGQEVLKALWRRRLARWGAAIVKAILGRLPYA